MSNLGVGVELHVPDFAPVKAFYGALGFDVVWENDGPGRQAYLVMRLGDAVLRFWPGNDEVNSHAHFGAMPDGTPRGFGVEIVVPVDNLEEVHKRAVALDAVVAPPADKSWGLRDFRVVDPYGYYLRFTEHHDVTSPDYGGRSS